jgi:hypothetical protein
MYTLFVAIDANVKLKRKNCGINDPELAPGWATFVEEGSYQNHIKNYIDQLEVRHIFLAFRLRLTHTTSVTVRTD